ncbi:hypothetical protein FSP39_020822 [Pinctada imbricata]|uniref:GPI mannosyltransferase 2 n=1 Tax=Pinctada imbricata TaxID=66713 RepID=A0AA88YQL3_PINIB|nr:hypothetical protein FSP39_020822 [Pinctada imbricata]
MRAFAFNMDDKCDTKIRKFALQSRLVVFALQLLFNVLVPDHDPGDVFIPPPSSRGKENYIDAIISANFAGFQRWDGLYFMHIAEHGYIYENSLAFFPLFPWCVRIMANYILFPLHYIMTYRSILLLAAFLLNLFLFVQAASLLYALGKKTIGDKGVAYKAALLFCINPASIFMSAPYSETLYTFLIFWGLHQFEKKNIVTASAILGFSALTRSNGLLNAGFQLHLSLKTFLKGMNRLRIESVDKETAMTGIFSGIIIFSFPLIFMMLLFLAPFVVYQYLINKQFCTDHHSDVNIPASLRMYGKIKGYNIVGQTIPTWCNNTLPLSYSHVQHSHWGVGFLQYYELKQIPNFLLALPVTILAVFSIILLLQKEQNNFHYLGIFHGGYIQEDRFSTNSRLWIHKQKTTTLCVSCHVPTGLWLDVYSYSGFNQNAVLILTSAVLVCS